MEINPAKITCDIIKQKKIHFQTKTNILTTMSAMCVQQGMKPAWKIRNKRNKSGIVAHCGLIPIIRL